jgi:hypothetical protein
MSEINMFQQASRLKLRFNTAKGLITVEDLWDLPLITTAGRGTDLDTIAKELHKLQGEQSISFVHKVQPVNSLDKLRFDIVLEVIKVRVAEQGAALAAADKKAQKQRLMEIISRKEESALEGTGIEDLRKMLEAL